MNKALQDPDLIAKLAQQGMAPGGGPPADFGARIAQEVAEWQAVARSVGIKPE